MITIPFPASEHDLNERNLAGHQWAFLQVDCHVCPEVLLSHAANPGVVDSDLLMQYLASVYLLVYPLLGSGLSEVLSEVRQFVAKNSSPSLGIVHCHGGVRENRWVLADRDELRPAEDLFKEFDGKYTCIVCMACNPVGEVVELQHSALLYYTGLSPLYFMGYEMTQKERGNQLFYKLPGRLPVEVRVDGMKSLLQLAQADVNPDTVNYFDH